MKDTRMDTPGTKPRYQTSGQSSRHVRTEDVWAEDVCTENVCTEDVCTEDGGSTGMLKTGAGARSGAWPERDADTGADTWAGTGADARAGFDPMEAVDISLARLASCPLHATRTQAFAVQAGLLFGRMVAIDSRESRDSPDSHGSRAQQPAASDRQQNMRTIQRLCSSWTILDPAASALLLTVVKPEVLYALIIFWPEHLPMSRPFYAAVLLGCYLEQMEGTGFLGENNNSGLLLDIIAESIAAASPDADNDAGAEADAI